VAPFLTPPAAAADVGTYAEELITISPSAFF